MHIVVFTPAIAFGGAEVVAGRLIAGLSTRHRVTVAGPAVAVVEHLAAKGESVRGVVTAVPSGKWAAFRLWSMRRALLALRADVVIFNDQVMLASRLAIACLFLSRHRPRLVAIEHTTVGSDAGRRHLAGKRWAAPRLDALVAVSHSTATLVREALGARLRVDVIHNGVDIAPDPEPAAVTTDGGFRVVFVGRLDAVKRVDDAIRAVVQVPNAHLDIVGDGPERAALESLIRELDAADRVTLSGWSTDVAAHLRAAHALVLPSRIEGFPLVMLEAMMESRPVIATDVGGVSEGVVDGTTGILVPPDDPTALAKAILELRHDDERRIEMGRAGRRRAEAHFSTGAMVASYERLLTALVPDPTPPATAS